MTTANPIGSPSPTTTNSRRTHSLLPPWLDRKLQRAREAKFIVGDCAADLGSRLALAGCYASILRDVTDAHEVAFRLKLGDRQYPFRMRRCDIFTIGEILYEQQYRMVSQLPPAPVIIDAGANVGVTALWFLWQHPNAVVHAFEPAPDNFRLLEANFGHHSQVVVNQAALGAARGKLPLHLEGHGAMHSAFGIGGRTVEVDCLTLRDYLREKQLERVDLLKLDVEGSELDVLRGLGAEAARVHRIVGEVHEHIVDVPAFYRVLDEAGFELVRRIDFLGGAQDGVHGFEAVRRA